LAFARNACHHQHTLALVRGAELVGPALRRGPVEGAVIALRLAACTIVHDVHTCEARHALVAVGLGITATDRPVIAGAPFGLDATEAALTSHFTPAITILDAAEGVVGTAIVVIDVVVGAGGAIDVAIVAVACPFARHVDPCSLGAVRIVVRLHVAAAYGIVAVVARVAK